VRPVKEHRDYWPRQYDVAEPAPDGAKWPCGHPKTEANTQTVGKGGARCRICRRKITRNYRRRKAGI